MDSQVIDDAFLLITYCAKTGIAAESEDVKLLSDLRNKLQSTALTSEDEASFWVTYTTLAGLAKPVTVESLRAVAEPTSRFGRLTAPPAAKRTIRFYTILTITTFICLVLSQVYWLVGDALTQSITKSRQQFDSDVANLYSDQHNEAILNDGTTSSAVGPAVAHLTTSVSQQATIRYPQVVYARSQTLAELSGYYQELWIWSWAWHCLLRSGSEGDFNAKKFSSHRHRIRKQTRARASQS
jgi:hypothetical protein